MSHDAVIVGGGPAGCAAAITLARGGARVLLLERERGPSHKVCGEFLSGEALAELAPLGIDLEGAGAVPLHSVRLTSSGERVVQHPLPFAARSLTRLALDAHLLACAEAAGAGVLRGVAAQRVEQRGAHWQVHSSTQTPIHTGHVLLATGKHDLFGRNRGAGKQANLVAFKMYFRLAPAEAEALAGHVELLLFPGGYGGLQPVEGGVANLCVLLDRALLKRLGAWPEALAHMQAHNPHLRARLAGAEPLIAKPLAISAIPYGWVQTRTETNLWCLGDQAAVIPSFTGDGMSIALYSGRLAAEMLLVGRPSVQFQQELHRTVSHQVGFATLLSRAMTTAPGRLLARTALAAWPQTLARIASHTRLRAPAPAR